KEEVKKEIQVTVNSQNDQLASAIIITTKTVNGKTFTETQTISGTLQEIEKKANEINGNTVKVIENK
ncbi:MAG: hypothetical protein NWQ17_05120, partial [Polaribacter sp.]|nr:hypothetical protein [Polaribacter sp.]